MASGVTVWALVKEWDRLALVLVFMAVATAIFVLVNNMLALRDRYTAPPPPLPQPLPTPDELRKSMTQMFIDGAYSVGAHQWNPSDFAFSVTDVAGRYIVIYKHEGSDMLTLTTWRYLTPEEKASVEALPMARYAKAQRRMRIEMARFGTWFDFTMLGMYSISVDISSLSEPWYQDNAFNFVRRGHVLLYALVEELLDDATDWANQQRVAQLIAQNQAQINSPSAPDTSGGQP